VVRALQEIASKPGKKKEQAWQTLGSKDVSRTSVDSFITRHCLTPTVVANDKTTKTTTQLWDLAPFTNFDAYSDQHFGTVWCDSSDNYTAVVAPAILELTKFHHSKKASERTKVTICLNTLRWNGKRWALDASFKGRKKETEQGKVYASTKAHRLTKLFIWLNDVRESASGVEKIRERLWPGGCGD
jgi:hypothetical protein